MSKNLRIVETKSVLTLLDLGVEESLMSRPPLIQAILDYEFEGWIHLVANCLSDNFKVPVDLPKKTIVSDQPRWCV